MQASDKVDRAYLIWTRAARGLWMVLAASAVFLLIASIPGYLIRFSGQLAHVPANQLTETDRVLAVLSGVASLASSLLSIGLSWVLYRQRFDNFIPAAVSVYLLIYSIVMAGPLEHMAFYWFGTYQFSMAIQGVLLGVPTFALLALFPDGRFVPRWMRWAFYLMIPWGISLAFVPEYSAENFSRYSLLFLFMIVGGVINLVLGIYSQIFRYRSVSTLSQRQQTKWVVFGFGLWTAYMLISSAPYFHLSSLPPGQPTPWWTGMSELGWWLSLNIIPVALTISMTRYNLWDIDRVINRTLVYGGLTASIIALYVVLVGGLGMLFQSSGTPFLPLIATALAAVLFQPLRARLQSTVNHMMYGDRDDPTSVLSKLGDQLQNSSLPDSALSAAVETLAHTLKLPYVAIEWGENGETVTSYGLPADNTQALALSYQGERVGWLRVAPRARGEPLSEKDYQLLENIAHQAGAVVYNARLTADLLRTRERLVTSREEERRRIRRDLHDGLGPELAGLTLKLDAARNLLNTDPRAADRVLGELKQQSQEAIAEIRNLVYNLRPPTLDELGLLESLRERAAQFSSSPHTMIQIRGPDSPSDLPAAVEVAAYRIVLEALNNVIRHSEADNCWVDFKFDDGLLITIKDDGSGLPEFSRAGVGISSMRERTAELGGELKIESDRGVGTTILARLPLTNSGV